MEDIEFTTPQDKLLVMLVERISALEDQQTKLLQAVQQSNKNFEHIWVKTASYFYSVELSFKDLEELPIHQESIEHNITCIDNTLATIKTIITNKFPSCKLSVDKNRRRYCSHKRLYIQFENRMMIDTLIDMLDIPLLYHVDIGNWNKLSETDMKTVLREDGLIEL